MSSRSPAPARPSASGRRPAPGGPPAQRRGGTYASGVRRRRSDNVLSANAFDAIQRVFGSEAMPVAALRGAGLALVDAIGPLKRAFARHAAGR